jgi:hypothetical protein
MELYRRLMFVGLCYKILNKSISVIKKTLPSIPFLSINLLKGGLNRDKRKRLDFFNKT